MASRTPSLSAPSQAMRFPVSRVPYLPALDGLRALAVLAVMLYHADLDGHSNIPWMKGGFIGVEVFFVISGYLITLLMLQEHDATGSIHLRNFWKRRFRRLLPAAIMLIIVVTMLYGLVPSLRAQSKDNYGWSGVAGLGYVSNWFQIVTGQSYTDGAPLLRHLWSLAVEEQFYIFWPLVMKACLRIFNDRHVRLGQWFFGISLFLTANTAAMYVAQRQMENPPTWFDWNLLYLGTQSRASGLLLGAGMAMMWRPYAIARSPLKNKGRLFSVLGLAGLAILLASCMYFVTDWVDVDALPDTPQGLDSTISTVGFAPLFCGGLLVVGLATMMLIASATHFGSGLGRGLLAAKPLHWIGLRSYGLYLWHWPVFQLFRPGQPGFGDMGLPFFVVLAIRLAITFGLTEVSYRYIETPVRRRGMLGAVRHALRPGPAAQPRRATFASVTLMSIGLPLIATSLILNSDGLTDVEETLRAGEAIHCDITDPACLSSVPGTVSPPSVPPGSAEPTSAPSTTRPSGTAPVSGAQPAATTVPATVATTLAPTTTIAPIKWFAVGDSVMLGASKRMTEQGIWTDARVNRQMKEGVELVRFLRDRQLLGDVVVVHLGTNGTISTERVDEIMALTVNVRRVVFVTVKVSSKVWEKPNNDIIRAIPARYPDRDVHIVDWNQLSVAQGNIFCSDGIHLCKNGAAYFTQLIVQAVTKK